ncbi:hypothetical protein [Phytoactinopolyspora halotolerans]|uniref:Nucleotidyltransferase domain-containing protein n=1 Tax=Phytoactinopolyspora halotolerans TaxID=1981512 RepID=A0A6L9SC61_9ACTN|nr:hypothetical protein [Phytoactinopolyspora halotolerans]NEE02264.1 hypothetical protein [Phytoactinopolyspora halotolerans]
MAEHPTAMGGSMLVRHGKEAAATWIRETGSHLTGFAGAFHTGSTAWAQDDDVLPPTSDVDVMVVHHGPTAPAKGGKFRYGGTLLEVSFMPMDALASAESVLRDYHLAGCFRSPTVIADPSGHLTRLQHQVAAAFAQRRWVSARGNQAMNRVRAWLARMRESDPLAEQATAWLFGTGVTTHVLLVAGLRNPTVRRRYAAVRELLAEHGQLDYHERLLDLLGCARLTRAQVEHQLERLEAVFAVATQVQAPSYPFDSDITETARPTTIEGSRELIADGQHREAVFWIVASYCRCLSKLSAAGVATSSYEPGLRALLADLGAATFHERRRRADRTEAALPELWRRAEQLMPTS